MHESSDNLPMISRNLPICPSIEWQRGLGNMSRLQPGLSWPVALLINEGKDIEKVVNQNGYLYFTTVDDLKKYIQKEFLAIRKKQLRKMAR